MKGKSMKKIISIILVMAMGVFLAACSTQKKEDSADKTVKLIILDRPWIWQRNKDAGELCWRAISEK